MTRTAAAQSTIGWQLWLYEHLNVARLVWNRAPVLEAFTRTDCLDFTEYYLAIQNARLTNHLKESRDLADRARPNVHQIARIAELADAPVIVILLPDENQINPALQDRIVRDPTAYDWSMPQTMLTRLFQHAGLAVIDLLPAFRDDPRCLYMNDTHWTPEGHELAARVIVQDLPSLVP